MQAIAEKTTFKQIKSPLNYIGGKYKLLEQILPLFPKEMNTFVDLFAGGCNVGLNVKSEKTICNDNLKFLVGMYQEFQKHSLSEVLQHIDNQITTVAFQKISRLLGLCLAHRKSHLFDKNVHS